MITLEIKKRDRDYGLFTWSRTLDFEIMTLFEKSEYLMFSVNGGKPRKKKINYKYRRFTLGKIVFQNNTSSTTFTLLKEKDYILLTLT
jgi:hypothetical protein